MGTYVVGEFGIVGEKRGLYIAMVEDAGTNGRAR